MKKILFILFIFINSFAIADESMPVMIGGETNHDACGAIGKVQGLDINGDGFLAVRQGAGSEYLMIDKLHNGDDVIFCDSQGKWIGIVYGKDCGTSSPIVKRQPYKGPCKSGWVFEKWVTVTAG